MPFENEMRMKKLKFKVTITVTILYCFYESNSKEYTNSTIKPKLRSYKMIRPIRNVVREYVSSLLLLIF